MVRRRRWHGLWAVLLLACAATPTAGGARGAQEPTLEGQAAADKCGGEKACEADLLVALGLKAAQTGAPGLALAFFEKALPLWRGVGDRSGEATTLNDIGAIYNSLGRKEKALGYSGLALLIARGAGDRSGEATALNNIGAIYNSLGRKESALACYERALLILLEMGERSGEAVALSNIGAVYDSLGEKGKALELYELALTIFREMGNRDGEAVTLSNIGACYNSLGRKEKALECYARALPILREVGDRSGEAKTLGNMAFAVQPISYGRAAFHAKQAVEIFQSLRAGVGQNEEMQRSYASSISGTYRYLATLLIGQGRLVEAQQVMELLESGGRIPFDSRETALDEAYNELVEALLPLNAEAGALRRKGKLSAEERQRLAALEQKLVCAEAKLGAFFDGIAERLLVKMEPADVQAPTHRAEDMYLE